MATESQSSIADAATVRLWQASFRESWLDELEKEKAFPALEQFVQMCETKPDDIIAEVLKPAPRGEGVQLRTRARRKYLTLIDDFESREGRQKANYVRSFMIHNGVAISPPILKD